MGPAKRPNLRSSGLLEGLFWVLRGPFRVPRNQRSVGVTVAIVVFPGSVAVWTVIQMADVRRAWPLAILVAIVGGLLLFGERRNRARLTMGAVACGIWLAGSMYLAQAALTLATGRVPIRGFPKVVVPRVMAIWPFLTALGFWGTGSVLWFWNERRAGPQSTIQRPSK